MFGSSDRRSVTELQWLEATHQCLADETRLAQRKQIVGKSRDTKSYFPTVAVGEKQINRWEIRVVCTNNSILCCIRKPEIKSLPLAPLVGLLMSGESKCGG